MKVGGNRYASAVDLNAVVSIQKNGKIHIIAQRMRIMYVIVILTRLAVVFDIGRRLLIIILLSF